VKKEDNAIPGSAQVRGEFPKWRDDEDSIICLNPTVKACKPAPNPSCNRMKAKIL
jgi:hypothetical protein